MPTYRAYRLDNRRRILTADWVEAPTDIAAVGAAEEMCDPGTPFVEIWQGTRLVEEVDCKDVKPDEPLVVPTA